MNNSIPAHNSIHADNSGTVQISGVKGSTSPQKKGGIPDSASKNRAANFEALITSSKKIVRDTSIASPPFRTKVTDPDEINTSVLEGNELDDSGGPLKRSDLNSPLERSDFDSPLKPGVTLTTPGHRRSRGTHRGPGLDPLNGTRRPVDLTKEKAAKIAKLESWNLVNARDKELRQGLDDFHRRDIHEQRAILNAKDGAGEPIVFPALQQRLCSALEKGDLDTIKLCANIMPALEAADIQSVLLAKYQNGESVLSRAIAQNQFGALVAFAAPLQQRGIRDSRILDALEKKDVHGNTAVLRALHNQDQTAIQNCAALLKCADITDSGKLRTLLLGKSRDGVPALYHALENSETHVIQNYAAFFNYEADTLKDVDIQRQVIQLGATPAEGGKPGILVAMQRGNGEAVKVFSELLSYSDLDKSDKQAMLFPKDVKGSSGISQAIQNGHYQAVRTYAAALQKLDIMDPSILKELTEAQVDNQSGGRPVLFDALMENKPEAIEACADLLKLSGDANPAALREWLGARHGSQSGLMVAIDRGNDKAIEAYTKLLEQSGIADKDTLTALVVSRQFDNTTGFARAFQNKHYKSINAYVALLGQTGTANVSLLRNLRNIEVNGKPLVEAALATGDTEAIKACEGVLQVLRDAQVLKTWEGKNTGDGETAGILKDVLCTPKGLAAAYKGKNVEAVNRYFNLLTKYAECLTDNQAAALRHDIRGVQGYVFFGYLFRNKSNFRDFMKHANRGAYKRLKNILNRKNPKAG